MQIKYYYYKMYRHTKQVEFTVKTITDFLTLKYEKKKHKIIILY